MFVLLYILYIIAKILIMKISISSYEMLGLSEMAYDLLIVITIVTTIVEITLPLAIANAINQQSQK